jgi:lysophospholipase L1-like esterase
VTYSKFYPGGFVDLPGKTTPITHAALDHIEQGLIDIDNQKGTPNGIATLDSGAKVPVANVPDLSANYAPINGSVTATAKGVLPANLVKYRKALAALRAGTSDVKVLCAGDSTVSGFGSGTPAYLGGWPSRLPTLVNTRIAPAAPGLAALPLTPDTDPRWTLGTGWTQFSNYGFGNSACAYAASAPAGNIAFADSRITADRFDVYYANIAGNGQLTVTATGGTPVVVTPSGAGGVAKLTCSAAAAATTNTLTIASAGVAEILFVAPWLSTTKTIRYGNAGRNGTTTNEWVDNSAGISSLGCIDAYAPDLTILCLGINDANNGHTLATFTANMNTIIARCQQTGDVILIVPHMTGLSSAVETLLASYRAAIPGIAASKGCMWLDESARIGAYAGSSFYFDTAHLNGVGYWDVAAMLTAALISF